MKFCKKDGSIMMLKKDPKKGNVWSCPICNSTQAAEDVVIEQKLEKREEIDIVDQNQEDSALPVTDAECEKCKNQKSYWWIVQTRASDEPETKFLKCTKCKHIWREYQ